MSKDQSIPRRNKVDWHMANNDPILTTMRFIPKHETVQKYGAILTDTLTNQAMKKLDAYKTYHDFAIGKVIPKPKYVRRSTREKTDQAPTASPGKRLKATAKMKIVTKRSKTQFHSSHASGSGADEETGVSSGVPDVPTYGSEDEQISRKSSDEDKDDEVNMSENDDDQDDDNADNEDDDEERQDEEDKKEEGSDMRVQQSSSVSSSFISNMLNPNPDTCIDSILNLNTESTYLVDVLVIMNVEMPPSSFEDKVKALEDDFSKFKQTNLFAKAISSIPGIVDKLISEAQADNEDFINKIDENMKKIIKEQVKIQVKEQVTKILPKIKKSVNEQLEAEVLIHSSNEAKTSMLLTEESLQTLVDAYESDKDILSTYEDTVTLKRHRDDEDEEEEPSAVSNRGSKRRRDGKDPEATSAPKEKNSKSTGKSKEGSKSHQKSTGKFAQAEEPIHADKDLEEPAHQEFDTGFTEDQPVDETTQHPDWFQKPTKPPTPDCDWNMTLPAKHRPVQPWINTLARNEDPQVCKATTDQLDWNNPEGQQYLHDLHKPLPLIPNSRGRRVIPFDHFINNDLAYLSGGVSSRTYATLLTKTKAADYGHIKWIEDLVPNTMWINRESVHNVYSRNKIIRIKKLTIVEWYNYKHLEWITVHRDDDKLYTFKEGDYNRLCLQDIEDMLLLLVQGKLTNLNI
ncbi:hypothetical protein Tco_0667091 [Tanacetum coccineum]